MELINLIFGEVGDFVKRKLEEEANLPKKAAITSTKTYLHCPHCEKQTNSTVDHVGLDKSRKQTSSFGPWYCNHCGGSFLGKALEDGSIELTLLEDKMIVTHDLLMLPANLPHPVYMVMNGQRNSVYEKAAADSDEDVNDRSYFYESHSCPTNWIPNIVRMIYDGDTDPHGLIKFVRGVDSSKIFDGDQSGLNIRQLLCNEDVLRKHFPETMVHEQFLEVVSTMDLDGESVIAAWFAEHAAPEISEQYQGWLFQFIETLIDEGKMGDQWMMDYYLSKEKDGVRKIRVAAYPKEVHKRINKDGKKVFVMATATLAVDADDKIVSMAADTIERSGQLED